MHEALVGGQTGLVVVAGAYQLQDFLPLIIRAGGQEGAAGGGEQHGHGLAHHGPVEGQGAEAVGGFADHQVGALGGGQVRWPHHRLGKR